MCHSAIFIYIYRRGLTIFGGLTSVNIEKCKEYREKVIEITLMEEVKS